MQYSHTRLWCNCTKVIQSAAFVVVFTALLLLCCDSATVSFSFSRGYKQFRKKMAYWQRPLLLNIDLLNNNANEAN